MLVVDKEGFLYGPFLPSACGSDKLCHWLIMRVFCDVQVCNIHVVKTWHTSGEMRGLCVD